MSACSRLKFLSPVLFYQSSELMAHGEPCNGQSFRPFCPFPLSELLGEVGAEPAVIRAAVGTDGTVHEGEAVAVEDVVDWQADGQEWQTWVEPCAADAVVFP